MNNVANYINKALEILIIFLMGVLVIDVLWQVFSRFVLSNPSSFTDELARFLLIWLSLFGGAYMMGKKQHLAIDLLSHRISESKSIVLDNVVQITIFIFCFLVLIIGGVRLVFVTFHLEQTSAALGLPLGYVYISLPISGLIICFYSVHFLLKNLNTSSTNKGVSHGN